MSGSFWFNGWESLGRVEVYAVVSFLLTIALIRVLGKRTISKMNPSDFVFTVALGSIIANWVLQSPVSLVDGIAATATMLLLQFGIERLTTRAEAIRRAAEGAPALLVYRGELLTDSMHRHDVNPKEINNALRQHGLTRVQDAGAVVLEIDGTFSVIRPDEVHHELLEEVR